MSFFKVRVSDRYELQALDSGLISGLPVVRQKLRDQPNQVENEARVEVDQCILVTDIHCEIGTANLIPNLKRLTGNHNTMYRS